MTDKFDDLIRKGEDIKALQYLAKELYNNGKIGGTRKTLLERAAEEHCKAIENESYASVKAIELLKQNEQLKQENEKLREALKKCSAFDKIHGEFAEDITYICRFCACEEHASDCQYIRLIGGE